jgi:hypothetical protein
MTISDQHAYNATSQYLRLNTERLNTERLNKLSTVCSSMHHRIGEYINNDSTRENQ